MNQLFDTEPFQTPQPQKRDLVEEKNEKVRAVLRAAEKPLGPTEIAKRVNEPWCLAYGDCPSSSAINPILKRIGAVQDPSAGFGKYILPKSTTCSQCGGRGYVAAPLSLGDGPGGTAPCSHCKK